jgi:hypothetical protein
MSFPRFPGDTHFWPPNRADRKVDGHAARRVPIPPMGDRGKDAGNDQPWITKRIGIIPQMTP